MQQFKKAAMGAHLDSFAPRYSTEDRDPEEPWAPELRTAWHRYLDDERDPEGFIEWVQNRIPDWMDNGLAQNLLGTAHFALGKPAEARECLVRSLSKRQGKSRLEASTLTNLAVVELTLGLPERAQAQIARACRLAPGLAAAQHQRLVIASGIRSEEAVNDAIQSLESDYPEWARDPQLTKGLSNDGELAFARNCSVWSRRILPALKKA